MEPGRLLPRDAYLESRLLTLDSKGNSVPIRVLLPFGWLHCCSFRCAWFLDCVLRGTKMLYTKTSWVLTHKCNLQRHVRLCSLSREEHSTAISLMAGECSQHPLPSLGTKDFNQVKLFSASFRTRTLDFFFSPMKAADSSELIFQSGLLCLYASSPDVVLAEENLTRGPKRYQSMLLSTPT